MGFYIRKSVRVGPIRFNLSKSGLGMSAGVKGFRVGAGPRGNYIHAGRGGFYYRASLPSGRTRPQPVQAERPVTVGSDGLTEIESGSVLQMTDTSADALLGELNEKHTKPQFAPWCFLAAFLLIIPFGALGLVIGFLVALAVVQWDRVRRATVLLYDLDEEARGRYQKLHDAFDGLASCAGTWHLEAEGATRDQKRHAGANTLIRRKRVRLVKQPPGAVRTNIEVPTVPAGRQTLCFFPDRLLVFDKGGVGAVSYSALDVDASPSQFIESETVPSDATVVGQTWRYVNKSGGPDKRFKDNRQIPICAYEALTLKSTTGLNEAFQLSKQGSGLPLREAVKAQLRAATAV
jgi:hypothetical protein